MNTTIKREDLDRGAVDFSDVVSGRRLPLVHPGEIYDACAEALAEDYFSGSVPPCA